MKKNLFLFFALAFSISLFSQKKFVRNGSFYFSWGYNTEWYSNSNIHVSQPGMGNDFTFQNIQAHDHIGWDRLFQSQISIPQYNYRIGYFFNAKQDLGIELNFDHTKYVVTQGQTDHVSGKMDGQNFDANVLISATTLQYQLNNGANFFLINIVKKLKFYQTPKGNLDIKGIGKFGVGPLVPHVQNTIFGNANVPHFQLGGWNTGLEAGVNILFAKHVYLEFTNKIDYARYFGMRVYGGEANQSFWCYELILTLGYTFHTGKKSDCETCPKF